MKPLIVSILAGCAPALISSAFGQDQPPPAPPAHPEPGEHAAPHNPDKESPRSEKALDQIAREIAATMTAQMEKAASLEAEGKMEEADTLRAHAKKRMLAAIEGHRNSAEQTKQEKQRQRAERIERADRDRQRQRLERGGRPADHPSERRDAPDRRPEGPPPVELERKLHHVEQAMGHLREAGLPDPAQNLEHLAERLRQALHDQRRTGPQGPDGPPRQSDPSGPSGPSRPFGPPPDAGRRDDELAALRREVESLKATVENLCKMAKPAEKSESREEPAPEKHH